VFGHAHPVKKLSINVVGYSIQDKQYVSIFSAVYKALVSVFSTVLYFSSESGGSGPVNNGKGRKSMKRISIFLLVLLGCLTAGPALAEGSKMAVEQADFDFGQIFQGEKVEHTFRFQNAGDEPLIIDRVRSSCGCTAALLSTKIIAAGDVAELKATFDSARFSGAVVKTIYLYSNDPVQQVTELHMRGTVKQEIVMSPPRLDLQNLVVGATKEFVVRLSNQSKKTLTLSGLQTTTPELAAVLSAEQVAPGSEASITIQITPKEGNGRLNGYVLLQTDSEHVPELRLPIYATVAPAAPR
jgi:hypothetical protein